MAIIDPDGLFTGERIGACSKEAQLYWPWLYAAANSYARLELSYIAIVSRVFSQFRPAPTQQELWSFFEEYARNFLAILYEIDGRLWCQFMTSEKYLPRYKTQRDEATPSPPLEMLEKHAKEYLAWKKARIDSTSVPSVFSENFRKFRLGVGVGVGVGIGVGVSPPVAPQRGRGDAHTRETMPDAERDSLVARILNAHPHSIEQNVRHDPANLRPRYRDAVLKGVASEIALGRPEPVAWLYVLERTRIFGECVPKDQRRFFKSISKFFGEYTYRVDPAEVCKLDSLSPSSRKDTKPLISSAKTAPESENTSATVAPGEAIPQIILMHPWTDYPCLLARRNEILEDHEIIAAVRTAISREIAQTDPATAAAFILKRVQELRWEISSKLWRGHCSPRAIIRFFRDGEYAMAARELESYWQRTKRKKSSSSKILQMRATGQLAVH